MEFIELTKTTRTRGEGGNSGNPEGGWSKRFVFVKGTEFKVIQCKGKINPFRTTKRQRLRSLFQVFELLAKEV